MVCVSDDAQRKYGGSYFGRVGINFVGTISKRNLLFPDGSANN